MKKVLCIDGDDWISLKYKKSHEGPRTGEECIVIEECKFKCGLVGYQLQGYPTDCYYNSTHFIPLSDKDETEYANEVMEKMFVPVEKQLNF